MCYLVTFATNEPLDDSQRPKNIYLAGHSEDVTGHYFPNAKFVWAATRGGCSCDLVRTAHYLAEEKAREAKKLEKLHKSYKQKGWRQSKVDRAISDATRNRELKTSTQSSRCFDSEFGEFLDGVLVHSKTLELILHWHSGEFFGETFDIVETVHISSQKPSLFEMLAVDTRYSWSR